MVPEPDDGDAALAPGSRVGRFTITGELAGGPPGRYEARDDDLGRTIALERVAAASGRLRAARALAGLQHPNVIAIHDVIGVGGGATSLLAIEHVDGVGLETHLQARRRGWREVLALFVQVGRGLAAAHGRGVVHGEVSAAAAMVDRHGRARLGGFAATDVSGEADNQRDFCAALRAALPARVPGWLERALRRGVARDPADRHRSMEALLAVLEGVPRRRRAIGLGLAAALLAGSAIAAVLLVRRGGDTIDCARAGARIDATWTPAARAALSAAIGAAPLLGVDGATRVTAAVDAWRDRWRAVAIESCRATHVRHDQPAPMLDRRATCLDEGRRAAAALFEAIAGADVRGLTHALDAARALPDPERCNSARLDVLAPRLDDPRVAAIEDALAKARASEYAGDGDAAVRHAEAALVTARALGDPGLRAHALALRSEWLDKVDAAAGRAMLEEALADAARARDPDLEAHVAVQLLRVAIIEGSRPAIESLIPVARAAANAATPGSPQPGRFAGMESEALLRLGRFAEALAVCDRIGTTGEDAVNGADCRCAALVNARRLTDAKQPCEDAVALARAYYGAHHPMTSAPISAYALLLQHLGDVDEALRLSRELLADAVALYGEASYEAVSALMNVAASVARLGDHREALALLQRGLAAERAVSKRPTWRVAEILEGIGNESSELGDGDAALRHIEEALHVAEALLGPDDPELAEKLYSLSGVQQGFGRHEEALASLDRALAIHEQHGGENPIVAVGLRAGQAVSLIALGRARDAVAVAERATELARSTETHALNRLNLQAILGEALLRAGDRPRARRELRAARAGFAAYGDRTAQAVTRCDELLAEL